MTRLRRVLGRQLGFSLSVGEWAAILASVGLINLIWPAAPVWIFLIVGVVIGSATRWAPFIWRKAARK